MKILKKIIIVFIIIVILTIITILMIQQLVKMNQMDEDQIIYVQSEIQKVKTYREYATVMYCVRNNLYSKGDYKIINAQAIYSQESTLTLIHYYIKATTKDITATLPMEYYVIATLDFENYNYEITQITKEEYEQYVSGEKQNTTKEINTSNKFAVVEPTDEEKCQMLLDNLLEKLSNDTSEVYNLLTENCKQENFKTYSDFQKYIEEKEEYSYQISAIKYKINKEVEYTKYTIVDEYNNQYIFYETSPLCYQVEITK